MCGAFAEFERGMIQERVKAGLERAKAQSWCVVTWLPTTARRDNFQYWPTAAYTKTP